MVRVGLILSSIALGSAFVISPVPTGRGWKRVCLGSVNLDSDEERSGSISTQRHRRVIGDILKVPVESIDVIGEDELREVMRTIEYETRLSYSQDQETTDDNNFLTTNERTMAATSESRERMTDAYAALKGLGGLRLFGIGVTGANSKPKYTVPSLTVRQLEEAAEMQISSLTPQPSLLDPSVFLGVALASLEGIISTTYSIPLSFLFVCTVLILGLEKLLLNGAISESIIRLSSPSYREKVAVHEAGHFLVSYLLGCPVEAVVLSPWAALTDSRFGGFLSNISAGTSFFDPLLSKEITDGKLTRSSIDRYASVVMAGIAAEALEYSKAEGGAADEQALVTFLSSISGSQWNIEKIKEEARIGAYVSIVLLKKYDFAMAALVDVFKRGGDLAEAVLAIEGSVPEEFDQTGEDTEGDDKISTDTEGGESNDTKSKEDAVMKVEDLYEKLAKVEAEQRKREIMTGKVLKTNINVSYPPEMEEEMKLIEVNQRKMTEEMEKKKAAEMAETLMQDLTKLLEQAEERLKTLGEKLEGDDSTIGP